MTFPYYWLNNHLKAITDPALSPYDRGFTLSDGLFETIKITNGKTRFLSEHIARLEKGCRLLHLPFLSRETIHHAIKTLIEACSPLENATLRLTYSRGKGGRGLTPPSQISPTFLLTMSPAVPTLLKPISLYISQYKRDATSPLHKIKSLAMLPSLLARYEAQENGAQDALFCNQQNYLTESTAANFLLLKNNMLYTPPSHHGLLEGISRKQLIEHKICEEKPLKIEDIPKAQAAWLVTALSLTPVSRINTIPLQRDFEWEKKILSLLYKSSI